MIPRILHQPADVLKVGHRERPDRAYGAGRGLLRAEPSDVFLNIQTPGFTLAMTGPWGDLRRS